MQRAAISCLNKLRVAAFSVVADKWVLLKLGDLLQTAFCLGVLPTETGCPDFRTHEQFGGDSDAARHGPHTGHCVSRIGNKQAMLVDIRARPP